MKHFLFKHCLKSLRKLAAVVQLGNPAHKAPRLMVEPEETEQLACPLAIAPHLTVWHLQQVLCCGIYSGALINRHNQVYMRFTSFPWGKELHPSLSSPYLGRRLPALNKAIFLMTPRAKANYYHWLADLLPRLLLIQKCTLADRDQYSIILHQPSRQYETDTLQLLGIRKEHLIRLEAFDTIAVGDVVIADYLHSPDGQKFPHWKKSLLDEFKYKYIDLHHKKANRRIYLLRGKHKSRRLLGEEKLVNMLSESGFEILDPQHLTLLEQMKTLSEAAVVVGLHGAALTNIIFCQPGTRVIELRSSHLPPEHYSEIAKTYDLQFESICLPPRRVISKPHLALEQHLQLTDQSLAVLKDKLKPLDLHQPVNFSF
jgi:hypothetical protein